MARHIRPQACDTILELTYDDAAFLRFLLNVAAEQPDVFGGNSVKLDTGAKMRYLLLVDRLRRKLP